MCCSAKGRHSLKKNLNPKTQNPKPQTLNLEPGDCAYALSSILFCVQPEYRRRMADLKKTLNPIPHAPHVKQAHPEASRAKLCKL